MQVFGDLFANSKLLAVIIIVVVLAAVVGLGADCVRAVSAAG